MFERGDLSQGGNREVTFFKMANGTKQGLATKTQKGGRQDPDHDSPMSGYRNAHAFLRVAAQNR